MVGTPSPQTISTKQLELAQRAERYSHEALSTLAHFIDLDWLRDAYCRTRKDGAPGVDGQLAAEYEADLEANLSSLLDRFKSGVYRAPPVKRVYIPKGDGKRLRPIGIPTLEDKVLQRVSRQPDYDYSRLRGPILRRRTRDARGVDRPGNPRCRRRNSGS
jgi:retron-type reverse transcriptase